MKILFVKKPDINNSKQSYCDYSIQERMYAERVKAYIVLEYSSSLEESVRNFVPPRGIQIFCMDGWNGSYHDAAYYGGRGIVIAAINKRAGFIGRLRHTANAVEELRSLYKRSEAKDAWLLGSMIHRGIVSREGD